MERHGSETYWVEGEGVVGESGGGRAEGASVAMAAAAVPPFRFSRTGPRGRQLGDANLRKIGVAMCAGPSRDSPVPAGFTYLGQFIDHDLSFDNTAGVAFGEDVSPARLLQARSPSLDLDSLYGAGPSSAASARFYRPDGLHLRTGTTEGLGGGGSDAADRPGFDLPRDGGADTVRARRRPLIPDRRNDENLAVAQTHAAFIRFHNRVVDGLAGEGVPEANRFALARRRVVKHYQWMIRHDFLPRIVEPAIIADVFTNGRKLVQVGADPMSVPTMPIEFSVAAYRLGHSMIRGAYNWNTFFDAGGGTLFLLFAFSGTSGDLAGGIDQSQPGGGAARLPSNWIADWRRLFRFGDAGRPDLDVPEARFNRAKRLDTKLVNPLRNLPPGSFGGPGAPDGDPRRNLAVRNLTRARMVRLASGQQMAELLRSRGVPVTTLTERQVVEGEDGADLGALTPTQRAALARDTPLWFYVLREAEVRDGRMTGVGGRIVAETFHRAMEGSRHSIVRDPGFRPVLGPDEDTFRMADLLLFAFEGKRALLNPLGNG